jgi:hypothetical protein
MTIGRMALSGAKPSIHGASTTTAVPNPDRRENGL